MDKIQVDTDLLDGCALVIGSCVTDSSSLAQEIQQVLSSLPESCKEKYSRVIQSYQKELQSISNDLGFLKKGVSIASSLLEECERIINSGTPRDTGEDAQAGGGQGDTGWMDDILDSEGIDKYGGDYVDPGIEAEQAQNEMMRRRINDLFDSGYFSDERWNSASAEERVQMLNSFKNVLNGIYGINVTADIAFFEGEESLCGYYQSSDNKVYLNVNSLTNRSREEVMNTIVHEMRHAYQYQVINDPGSYIVSEETARAWEQNWSDENYITYDPALDNYDDYYNQPLEADAFGFADSIDYSSHNYR